MARAKKASFSLMPNLLGLSWSGREGTHYMHETDTHACVVCIHTCTYIHIHIHENTHVHMHKHPHPHLHINTQTPTPPPHSHSHSHSPTHTHMYVHMCADRQTEKERERESDTHTPPLEPWAFGSHCPSQCSMTRSRPTREVRHGSSPSSPGRRFLCSTHADGTAGIGAKYFVRFLSGVRKSDMMGIRSH